MVGCIPVGGRRPRATGGGIGQLALRRGACRRAETVVKRLSWPRAGRLVRELGLCRRTMLTTLATGMTLPPPPFYRFRPHPWHGLDVGLDAPRIVNAYIELTPFDTMKYEIDKSTGYLIVDRPQRSSALSPTLY